MQNKLVDTTDRDFKIFVDECKRLIQVFGLKNYIVFFNHNKELKNTYANIEISHENRQAMITLCGVKLTDDPNTLKKSAMHEIIHLITGRLSWLASCRWCTEGEIDEESENLSVLFENVLVGKI